MDQIIRELKAEGYSDAAIKEELKQYDVRIEIKNSADLERLFKFYSDAEFFEIIETREVLTLPDLMFCYDGQEITIRPVI